MQEADGLEDVVPRAEAEAAVRAAEARLVGLEAEKRRLKESNDALRKQTLELRDQIDARDGEIKRLGGLVEKGRDLERMTLQHKAESAEKRCTALDQQVRFFFFFFSSLGVDGSVLGSRSTMAGIDLMIS